MEFTKNALSVFNQLARNSQYNYRGLPLDQVLNKPFLVRRTAVNSKSYNLQETWVRKRVFCFNIYRITQTDVNVKCFYS